MYKGKDAIADEYPGGNSERIRKRDRSAEIIHV